MIKQIILENIEIDGTENNLVVSNVSGKIVKVLYKPRKVEAEVNLKILTKEGEEVMSVSDMGVYYPRANISTQKKGVNSIDMSGDKTDYFYFYDKLFLNISTNNSIQDTVVEKIVIIYEE